MSWRREGRAGGEGDSGYLVIAGVGMVLIFFKVGLGIND